MNIKRKIKIGILTIVLGGSGIPTFAQDVATADTIGAEETVSKKHITQVPLEQCEQIDTCSITKFAIVTKDGKQGIYDLEKHENVTEIDFDVAGFSRRYVSEDGIEVFYFYVEKGIERGIIGVTGENNQTVGIWHDNPNYVATLDECTTIDSMMTQKCQDVLSKGLKMLNGTYGQIAVIDAQTGRLNSWVALEKDSDEYSEGKLLKQACSPHILTLVGITPMLADIEGSLNEKMDLCGGIYNIGDSISIRDHNWRSGGYGVMTCRQALTHKSNITPLGRKYLQEVLIGLNKGDGIQASYAPKKVDIAGIYGNYQGKEVGNGECEQAEMSFVGVLPVNKPRYAMAIFINRPNTPIHDSKDFANGIVNELVEWLSKH